MGNPLRRPLITDRYELRELIGQGGMGLVYRAYDREAEREVALKALHSVGAEELYRLKNEFRALAGLSHPNLAQLYELTVVADECFFTMELVDGANFLDYVRGGGTRCDFERLGACLPQLADGLAALHAAGKLHRDIKPGNVLVAGGRVVMLDFGLVTALASRRASESTGSFVGTLAYMAPEQLGGFTLSAATDWYAFGIMLYEALTGRLPFTGAGLLLDRHKAVPPSPRTLIADIPEHLDALTMRLLRPAPEERPPEAELLRLLGGCRPRPTAPRAPAPPSGAGPFVGRAAELGMLADAFDETRRGAFVSVEIQGASGIGKTALLRRFLDQLEREDGALVLRARCHPQESVPFKAVDGLVDGLSHFLVRQPPAELPSLLPRNTAALARLFPVLARVSGFGGTGRESSTEGDLHEARRRALAALRDLLGRLADRRPVVLWIDDLQWGDLDSAAVLRALEDPPEAPPLLLLLSFRPEGPLLPTLRLGEPRRQLELQPLEEEETRELARKLLAGAPATAARHLEAVAAESGGNPFFIGELIRWLTERLEAGEGDGETIDLADVIGERLDRLPAAARRLLELVAVAGEPVAEEVAMRASGTRGAATAALSLLNAQCLLRPVSGATEVETWHDRIRETVVGRLSVAARQQLHRQLAETLEALPNPDPNRLVTHHLLAGDARRAGEYAYVAAERAAEALAFHRAIHLYGRALELGTPSCPAWLLHAKLGQMLAYAGQGVEAARKFANAAEKLGAESPGDPRVVQLERTAAEQYLRSGYRDEGLRVMRKVLRTLGLPYSTTPARSLLYVVLNRPRLAFRKVRPPSVSPRPFDLARLETYWSAGLGVSGFDLIQGAEFQVRHALLALGVREPTHVARALSVLAFLLAAEGGDKKRQRSARLLIEAERLAAASGDANVEAHVLMNMAGSAFFAGRWREAVALADRGEALCRERGKGALWELANLQLFAGGALNYLGDFATLRARLPEMLREARQRDDQYALGGFGLFATTWLAADDPAEARRQGEATLAAFRPGEFHTQHYIALLGQAQVELYLGEARAAWERVQRAWPALRRSFLLRNELVRIEMHHLRARCALGVLAAGEQAAIGWKREPLLRDVAREARRIASESLPCAAAFAGLVRAGAEACRGDPTAAIEELERAAASCEMPGLGLHAAAARFHAATLRGDRTARAREERWMIEHGVERPERMAAVLVSGF